MSCRSIWFQLWMGCIMSKSRQRPPNDQAVEEFLDELRRQLMSDSRVRLAILGNHKADVTIFIHRGEIARDFEVLFHPT